MYEEKNITRSPTITVTAPAQEPTTKREVWAWWIYMMAIEPISIVVLQLFLSLLLEKMPLLYGHLPGQPLARCKDESSECIIWATSWFQVNGDVYSYGIITLSVALQAIVFICFGALADYGTMRRLFMALSTGLGASFCVATLLIGTPTAPLIAALLNVLITVAFGVSLMLYNSYLPVLAQNHPDTTDFHSDDPIEMRGRREAVSSELSTKSFMLGYGSAIGVLVLCLSLQGLFDDKIFFLKGAVAFCGLYWGLGAIYPLMNLKPRPGPPLPEGSNILTFSVKKTGSTLSKCNRLPHTFRYLIAFFLFADGCNTIGSVAVIFASRYLKVETENLIHCAILAPFCGVLGNLFFFYLQKKLRVANKTMLLWNLCGFLLLTIYAGIGIFTDKIGIHKLWEVYMVSIVYGFLMGAMQSFSRVIYGEMIPPGEEAEFFSIYAITDKGSSWLGPAIQAIIGARKINPRWGFVFLGAMILAPFPLLIWYIDPVAGKADALEFTQKYSTVTQQEMSEEKN